MATLSQRIADLATRIATQCKTILTLVNGNAADLSGLTTTAKGNLVLALNELKGRIDGVINDAAPNTSAASTYSAVKITALVNAAIAGVLANAPAALDTLKELADAINDDANFAGTMTAALAARLRIDTNAQGLTAAQQANGRANLDVYGTADIGSPDTNFVATFTAGLA